MASVNVDSKRTNWGVTHLVTGKPADVRSWCKKLEKSSGYRVLCRQVDNKETGTVTWRADVDSNYSYEKQSSGPGFLACVAIGLGLGFFFGG